MHHPWTSLQWYSILQRYYNLAFSLFTCLQIFLGTYYLFQCIYQVVGSSSIHLVIPTCRLKFLPQQTTSKEPNPHALSIYHMVHEQKYRMLQMSSSHTQRNLKSLTPKLNIFFWESLRLKESFISFLKVHWKTTEVCQNLG